LAFGQPHHAFDPKSIIIRMTQLTDLELTWPYANQGNSRRDELQSDNWTEGIVNVLPKEKTHWVMSGLAVGVVIDESFCCCH
jgi:hypothetical protein